MLFYGLYFKLKYTLTKSLATMEKIAIVNYKGGVGKTTLTANLGYAMAAAGKKTLLIDLDPQHDLSKMYAKKGFDDSIYEVLENKKYGINEAIYEAEINGKIIENLFILPSVIELSALAETLATAIFKERLLSRQLDKLSDRYDYILFDCPPARGILSILALYCADRFLIPIDGGTNAIDGIVHLYDTIAEVKDSNAINYTVVRHEHSEQTAIEKRFNDRQVRPILERVAKTKITRRSDIKNAGNEKLPVAAYKHSCQSTLEYERLMKEVCDG